MFKIKPFQPFATTCLFFVGLSFASTVSYAGGKQNTRYYAKGASVMCNRGGCVERPGGGLNRGPAFMAMRQACRPEAFKFCGAVIQDSSARAACMRQHFAQLSGTCRQARLNAGVR
jgi:hypothetical protein